MTKVRSLHGNDPWALITHLREAADLAFASADVAPEHTQAYDEVCRRVDALLETPGAAISPHPAKS